MARRKKAPSYLHHKSRNKGYARATDPKTGKRLPPVYFPGKFDTAESRAAYADWLGQADKPAGSGAATVYTCQQVAALFMEDEKSRHDLDCRKGRSKLGEWRGGAKLLATLNDTPVNSLTLPDVCQLQDRLADGLMGDLSLYTINSRVGRVVAILKWATRKGYAAGVIHDIKAGLEPFTERTHPHLKGAKEVHPADPADVDTLRPFLSPTVATMVDLQGLCGFRAGELVQLSWDLIVKDDPDFHGCWYFEPPQHKNRWRKKTRRVFIGPVAQKLLTDYEAARPVKDTEFIFTPREAAAHCFLMLSQKFAANPSKWYAGNHSKKLKTWQAALGSAERFGWQFTTNTYRQSIHHGCKRAGIDKLNTHQLRHLTSTRIDRTAGDLGGREAAAAVLGHSITAAEIYAGKNHELAARVMAELG